MSAERVAELEARVVTLEEQMQDLANIVGGLIDELGGVDHGGEMTWGVADDAGPGDEPAPFGLWLPGAPVTVGAES